MKESTVQIYEKRIDFKIRKSKKAKRLRLTIYYDGSLVVTLPKRVSESTAKKYIVEKSKWVDEKIKFFENLGLSRNLEVESDEFLQKKEQALEIVLKRVEILNKTYRYKYNKISIKNQKTRWGSCSKKKNLNFNFRIISLPPKLRDYIIVHELCHLKEFNHSRKFWNLVAGVIANYKEIIKELKLNGLNIS